MPAGFNLAVLAGTLSSDPRPLDLASGSTLLRLEVTTPGTDDGRAESVPVAWFDPPRSAPELRAGEEVLVVGRVRRRWWAGGGGPRRSSTEVLATQVWPTRRRAPARRALRAASDALDAVVPE